MSQHSPSMGNLQNGRRMRLHRSEIEESIPRNHIKSGHRYLIKILLSTLIISSLLLGTNCNRDEDEVLVFAAVSMKDVLTPIAEEFSTINQIKIRFNFGASTSLAQQISWNSPADLYISAGDSPVELLLQKDLIKPGSRRALVTNQLVLIVPSGKSKQGATIEDILLKSKRIAIADPNLSPAGIYAKESLENLGLWDILESRLIFGSHVRNVLTYVESGNVDAGFVYITDTLTTNKVEVPLIIPTDKYSPIIYPIVLLKTSPNPSGASQFRDFLFEEPSISHFNKYGFNTAGVQMR